ncbi:hypothetical protein PSEUBRA_006153 [Kalmanozyma brasiliensis GHG001]|uniref:uncharacterized protein n=1 Tax=Kalmanozyma brasiliensis (strain GHG001) TaxID=1365824 RepID=UPI001CEB84D6|nr:uncharacterized protein PSEUBRA_006153 [Kalmanozyma brasiliensis GHG001]KAF6767631.1 hypothetical protein PSEUBRA_006153 [Kalmanozyma brasiliensis GHG001]
MRSTSTILIIALLALSLLQSALATVIEDPLLAQANSFGWLAIRNFTYCLSTSPDPPNKPRGIQPKRDMYTPVDRASSGMGDSVVVLYHPEETSRPIAWCNTLVAFQSMPHVRCHGALPTCQRCDAVRSPTDRGASWGQEVRDGASRAPSGKLGQSTRVKSNSYDSPTLQRRTDDALQALPGQSYSGPRLTPRPFGSTVVHNDLASDAELEAAISEFQDFCENKLTLAVRADCPLHVVRSWYDEPPFDLHRFCMALTVPQGYSSQMIGGRLNHAAEGDTLDGTGTDTGRLDGSDDPRNAGEAEDVAGGTGANSAYDTGADDKEETTTSTAARSQPLWKKDGGLQ